MDMIKKAGVLLGGTVGGLIGGTISLTGKMANVKFLDELGMAIVDSTLITGSIVGDVASGVTELAAGAIRKRPEQKKRGIQDLKSGGGTVFHNWLVNLRLVVDNGGEIVEGVKEHNKYKVLNGTKTLGKAAAIGFVTVGAIKVDYEKTNAAEKSHAAEKEDVSKASDDEGGNTSQP